MVGCVENYVAVLHHNSPVSAPHLHHDLAQAWWRRPPPSRGSTQSLDVYKAFILFPNRALPMSALAQERLLSLCQWFNPRQLARMHVHAGIRAHAVAFNRLQGQVQLVSRPRGGPRPVQLSSLVSAASGNRTQVVGLVAQRR